MPKGKFGDDRINKKNSTFQMRSGNSPMFKMVGSSPHKSIVIENIKKKLEERKQRRQGEQEQPYTPPKTDNNPLNIPGVGTQERTQWYMDKGWALDETTPAIESKIDIQTKPIEKVVGDKETKIEKVNKSDTKTKKTKLTKEIDRIGGSITEATTTKGKLDLFGEGKLFGKKSKTPRTKVIKGVEKEWRGGRWMTKKPAPTKNYKKGYYGA